VPYSCHLMKKEVSSREKFGGQQKKKGDSGRTLSQCNAVKGGGGGLGILLIWDLSLPAKGKVCASVHWIWMNQSEPSHRE